MCVSDESSVGKKTLKYSMEREQKTQQMNKFFPYCMRDRVKKNKARIKQLI